MICNNFHEQPWRKEQICFRTLTTINLLDKMFLGINFVNLNSKHLSKHS